MKKFAALLLTAVFAVAAYAEDTYNSCYKSGVDGYKKRKYAAAVKELDKALKLAPKDSNKASTLYYKGHCLYRMRKYKDAGDTFAKILDLKVDGDQKAAYAGQGIVAYALAKDYDKAHALADKLLALEMKKATNKHILVYNKAYAFNRQKKYDDVHKTVNTIIKDVDPKSYWRYCLDMQKISAHNGKKEYQAVLDAFPDSYIKTADPKRQYLYYYQRGAALYNLKKYAEALKEFEALNKLNAKYPYSYYYIGLCNNKLKQYDKAVAAFAQMKKLANNVPSTLHNANYNAAIVYFAMGENQKSADACKENYDNPKMPAVYKGYALLYSYQPLVKLGKKDEAKANLEKLVKLKGAASSHKRKATALLKKL